MRDFRDLDAWKKSIELVERIYEITVKFPKEEIYGLTSQIRRATVSVSSNISEGCGRRTSKDFAQFLYNAFGSVKEVECQLIIADKLGYLEKGVFDELMNDINDIGKILRGFIDYTLGRNIK